jgi:hypothetical protein
MEKARALAVAVGTGYSYETTFEKEVYSDLYGERGVLMGGIRASPPPPSRRCLLTTCCTQRECSLPSTRSSAPTDTPPPRPSTRPLRRLPNLSSPSSVPTVRPASSSSLHVADFLLLPGMDYMFAACSTTARRGGEHHFLSTSTPPLTPYHPL